MKSFEFKHRRERFLRGKRVRTGAPTTLIKQRFGPDSDSDSEADVPNLHMHFNAGIWSWSGDQEARTDQRSPLHGIAAQRAALQERKQVPFPAFEYFPGLSVFTRRGVDELFTRPPALSRNRAPRIMVGAEASFEVSVGNHFPIMDNHDGIFHAESRSSAAEAFFVPELYQGHNRL